jgi:hypothetical protein
MAGCVPLREPFRRARQLVVLVRELGTQMAAAARATDTTADPPSMFDAVKADLDAAARALAGKSSGGAAASSAGAFVQTAAQARARIAADALRKTPGEIGRALRSARARLPGPALRSLRLGGRDLLQGTRALRRELRRMTRTTGTFVR